MGLNNNGAVLLRNTNSPRHTPLPLSKKVNTEYWLLSINLSCCILIYPI